MKDYPPFFSGHDADHVRLVEQQLDHLERQYRRLMARERQANQVAALGIGTLQWAHELNNLITPALAYARSALQGEDPVFMRKALRVVERNMRTVAVFSERVLSMARRGHTPRPERVDLSRAISEALESIGMDPNRPSIQVEIQIPEGLKAWVDPHALLQVLSNLFLNARAAMKTAPGRMIVEAQEEEGRVRLSISDTGSGIDPEVLPRVFDLFHHGQDDGVEDETRCRGIGLALCRELLEENGGTITVESRLGQGTTFHVDLPENAC